MNQIKGWLIMAVIAVGVVLFANGLTKFTHDALLGLCWAKYDTPACHERLEAEKALAYKQAMEKH